MPLPTRSVPGGCVIMLTGFASLTYGLLAAYGIWKINHAPDPAKYQDLLHSLTWSCAAACLLGIILIILGWRLALKVRNFDPHDPDEPMMKF